MEIAVISDLHLGFSLTKELENDSYENAFEAFEKALDSDIIILAGDIFDTKSPKPKSWYFALSLLSLPFSKESKVKLIESSKELPLATKERTLKHLPVIAIHGNHDRNLRGEKNIIEALEKAGLLVYLHRNYVVFEKDGIKVAIHGMSHVPERFAYEMLKDWNPKSIENAINILVLHQNIGQYVYSPIQKPTIDLNNLPEGFDIVIDGHIHLYTIEKFRNGYFLIPGSTVITQFQPSEAEIPKGFLKIRIENGKIDVKFVSLENQRKFFYEKIEVEENWKEKVEERIKRILTKSFSKKPIIKIKLIGKDLEILDKEIREIENKFKEKAIILISKEVSFSEIEEKFELLKNIRDQKISIRDMGLIILKKNLEDLGFKESFDVERLIKILEEKDIDLAMDILLGKIKGISSFLK
ncbi:MAG: hypothetical protein B6U78_00770 [Candidatus Aenigmarchaeota archaeon ex4484_224]|nr:MAG: hypothetical protein B6U78_00770 [Candidatus Aenigmarchaeota archaeon ex4484_224]